MNYAGKQIDNLKTVCFDAEKNEIPTNNYVRQIQGFSENDEDIYIQILINITGHSKESLFLKREDKDANADLFMQFYEEINKEKTPQLKVLRTAN